MYTPSDLKKGLKIGEERAIQRAILETYVEDALILMESLKMGAEDVLELLRVPVQKRGPALKMISERLVSE